MLPNEEKPNLKFGKLATNVLAQSAYGTIERQTQEDGSADMDGYYIKDNSKDPLILNFINFQTGNPVVGVNGVREDALLIIIMDHLAQRIQTGDKTPELIQSTQAVMAAAAMLGAYFAGRERRGVEGTILT